MRGAYTDSESEANTSLAGADVVEQQDARVDLDLTKPFTWGGSFAFHFDTQQSRTNNSFFNAPELIQDNVRVSYTQPLFRGRGVEAQTAQQREAEIVEQQRREDRRGARQTLLHDVEVAYWELRGCPPATGGRTVRTRARPGAGDARRGSRSRR